MSDSDTDSESDDTIRVRKGSERARRFFSFFGIRSARMERERQER
ncbi:hypothetical protein [Haloglomus litoreum]|nr:hypothetical protein [Haloglomus sp. DT116]